MHLLSDSVMTVISAGSLDPTAFSTVTVILNSVNDCRAEISVVCRELSPGSDIALNISPPVT